MLYKLVREIINICNFSLYIFIWVIMILVSNNKIEEEMEVVEGRRSSCGCGKCGNLMKIG